MARSCVGLEHRIGHVVQEERFWPMFGHFHSTYLGLETYFESQAGSGNY